MTTEQATSEAAPETAQHEPTLTADRPFYGQPFWWLVFAILLIMMPIIGYMLQADMVWDETHPAINALLNSTGMVFMIAGFVAIKRDNIEFHKRCMVAAICSSLVFLVSYLIRYSMSGSHPYPGNGIDKVVYLSILISHMILAAVTLPLVMRTAYLAWKDRLYQHRRMARIVLPMWLYVSVTGVAVYMMLYHMAPALYGD